MKHVFSGGKIHSAGWLALSLLQMTGLPSKMHASRTVNDASWGAWLGPGGALAGGGIGALRDTYHAGDDTKNVLSAARAALQSGDLNKMKAAQQALLAQSQKLAKGGGSQNMNRAITFLTGRLGDFEDLNFKLQHEIAGYQSPGKQARALPNLLGGALKPKAPKYTPGPTKPGDGSFTSVWKDMGMRNTPAKGQVPNSPLIPFFNNMKPAVMGAKRTIDSVGVSADVSKIKIKDLKGYLDSVLRSGGTVTVNADTRPAMVKLQALAVRANTILSTGFGLFGGPGLFTGGETQAGKGYWTGEMGMEAWVSRSGAIKMLGANGPEFVKPGSGAVIPASATSNPYSGNTGLAPEWAVDAYRKAVAGTTVTKPRSGRSSGSAGDLAPLPGITIGPNTFTSEVDVERAAVNALRKYEEERQERQ